jgi:mannosylfructose-phosphate synthase
MADHGRIMMLTTHGYVAAQPELGRPDTGGQVVYVLELSRTLARLGYDVDIVTRRFDDQAFEESVDRGVRILRFACGGPNFIAKEHLHQHIDDLADRLTVWAAKNEVTYDWINSHYWDAGLAGAMLGERFAVPHFFTPHSLGVWKRNQSVGTPEELELQFNFRRRIAGEREICRRCDLVVATTDDQRHLLRSPEYSVPSRKLHVLPPGYDDMRFFPVSSSTREALRRRFDYRGPVLYALGRIAENKGYDLLVAALPTIVSRRPDARLVLAIGSKSPTTAERMAVNRLRQSAEELGVADHIHFDDHVPDADLADRYRAADVFVLSSRYEPFGMTAVEAMACGTPTVVTNQGGLWHNLTWGRDALSVDPRDPEALGHTVLQVLGYDQLARRLSRCGGETVRKRFTWTAIAAGLLRMLGQRNATAATCPGPADDADEVAAESYS